MADVSKNTFSKVVVVSNNGQTLSEGVMIVTPDNVRFEDGNNLNTMIEKIQNDINNVMETANEAIGKVEGKIQYVTQTEYNNLTSEQKKDVTFFIQ